MKFTLYAYDVSDDPVEYRFVRNDGSVCASFFNHSDPAKPQPWKCKVYNTSGNIIHKETIIGLNEAKTAILAVIKNMLPEDYTAYAHQEVQKARRRVESARAHLDTSYLDLADAETCLQALVDPDAPKANPYAWIKVKKYVDDPSLSWEERHQRLNAHHVEETTFLIDECNRLRKILE